MKDRRSGSVTQTLPEHVVSVALRVWRWKGLHRAPNLKTLALRTPQNGTPATRRGKVEREPNAESVLCPSNFSFLRQRPRPRRFERVLVVLGDFPLAVHGTAGSGFGCTPFRHLG
jgi:hypothetical protein